LNTSFNNYCFMFNNMNHTTWRNDAESNSC